MAVVQLSSRHQITIPEALRAKLGIRPGMRFSVTTEGHSVLLTPVPDDPISYLCGIFEDGPSLTQDLLEERRRDPEHE